MISLKNKVVIITGSANGLGKALAKEFYKGGEKYTVFLQAMCISNGLGVTHQF